MAICERLSPPVHPALLAFRSRAAHCLSLARRASCAVGIMAAYLSSRNVLWGSTPKAAVVHPTVVTTGTDDGGAVINRRAVSAFSPTGHRPTMPTDRP